MEKQNISLTDTMNNKFAILVNTCDKFEDCWNPFFKLFSIYWPDYKGKIYLNTEYKNFTYVGLDIVSIKGCEKHNIPKTERATWSQCLKWALEEIDSNIVLYMQEDYFLKNFVKNEWIDYFYNILKQHLEIPCIHLTSNGIPAKGKSEYEFLEISDPDYFSYLSCQSAFWHKNVLLSLIRDHETAWNFEWWGSKRAKYLTYNFLTVDPVWLNSEIRGIIPYITTGVIGGRWYNPIVDLFRQHNINMDFSKRGFYSSDKRLSILDKIKVKRSIWKIKSIIEIVKMKYNNTKYKT
jgi:hypothetical protein